MWNSYHLSIVWLHLGSVAISACTVLLTVATIVLPHAITRFKRVLQASSAIGVSLGKFHIISRTGHQRVKNEAHFCTCFDHKKHTEW